MLQVKEVVLTNRKIRNLIKKIGDKVDKRAEQILYIPKAGKQFAKCLGIYLDIPVYDVSKVKNYQNSLLVDCICDTGKTLKLYKGLVKPLQTAVLVSRQLPGVKKECEADLIGLVYKKSYFLVGFGLDYNDHFRELPFIWGCKMLEGGSFYTREKGYE